MKLKKAMKKLKFWSSKKTKKKDSYYDYYHKLPPQYDFYPYIYHSPPPPQSPLPSTPMPPPPPPEGCECHFCYPAVPSAPPLPSWLEPQLQEGFNSSSDDDYSNSFSNSTKIHDHCIATSEEIMVITTRTTDTDTNTSDGILEDRDKNEIIDSGSSELQQLSLRSEKDGVVGLFGCIVDVSALLFRCFIPCLNISQRQSAAPILMASPDVRDSTIVEINACFII
ncbi:uncharacterized protein LOC110694531 [Chenopodium quinoa]|uniref:uncharacterized protein LOC110694531 n=1 Tax=Chenopodium quinoa TaxID=63459 RepID=UPI000B780D90|nr:uncharacterized protein LOC110694531 [Chenopodium quinoa]